MNTRDVVAALARTQPRGHPIPASPLADLADKWLRYAAELHPEHVRAETLRLCARELQRALRRAEAGQ